MILKLVIGLVSIERGNTEYCNINLHQAVHGIPSPTGTGIDLHSLAVNQGSVLTVSHSPFTVNRSTFMYKKVGRAHTAVLVDMC